MYYTVRMMASLVLTSAVPAIAADPDTAPSDSRPPPEATECWTPVPPDVATPAGRPPSDAIILFDGGDLLAWESLKHAGQSAPWRVESGLLIPVEKSGNIRTREVFGDLQLHMEFRFSEGITGGGQRRGNSGVFLMGIYEIQILDSYHSPTYVNGLAGSIYKQHPPLVNASRPPGEWQTFDIVWEVPRFSENGELESPARVTVLHNGVLVQNASVLTGPTAWRGRSPYKAHPAKLPLVLQQHGNDSKEPIAFRNIWVREINRAD